jgi:NAD(P)-dependent dehydrogenase (short-subunit alcohol dehydrogenase family)
MTALQTRRYDARDQERFAELSGDYNPLHLDPIAARRQIFGEVVVHGMHALLDALETYLAYARPAAGAALTRLSASFRNPIPLGRTVTTVLVGHDTGEVRLEVRVADVPALSLRATLATDGPGPHPGAVPAAPSEPTRQPRERSLVELVEHCGELGLWIDSEAARANFPHSFETLGAATLARLLVLTRLVGMDCPGLRSMFIALDVEFDASVAPSEVLHYRSGKVSEAASFIQVLLESAGLSGKLDTLCRPAPQAQAGLGIVAERVTPGEFAAQRALIVGGSRGLGEVTARILAAGGGQPIISYHQGRDDAEALCNEIRASGATCRSVRCDITQSEDIERALDACGDAFSHIYYFATPPILKHRGRFDERIYQRFAAVYVDAFGELCSAALARGCDGLAVFYPSSTIIDEELAGLEEYRAAKLAGEALCERLVRRHPGLRIGVRRLSRVATDQTLTLAGTPAADPLDAMLDIVREMNHAPTRRF